MINLDQLRIFQAVAQAGSFTRAAELVHLTQPGISKHIKQIEDYYGIPLFDRLGRKVALTQPGEILVEATREVMILIGAAEQRIQDVTGMRAGKLHLGASFPIGLYILPGVLAAYRKSYPAVEVKLEISTSENIEAEVLANRLDIGFVNSEVHNPKLLARKFMTDELVAIVHGTHKWSARSRIKARDLLGETFIVSAQGAGARAIVEERLQTKGIVLQNVLDFANPEGVKRAVEAGLGISIQPRIIVEREISAGSLRALRLADMDTKIEYLYIRHKSRHVSSAAKPFPELLPKTIFQSL